MNLNQILMHVAERVLAHLPRPVMSRMVASKPDNGIHNIRGVLVFVSPAVDRWSKTSGLPLGNVVIHIRVPRPAERLRRAAAKGSCGRAVKPDEQRNFVVCVCPHLSAPVWFAAQSCHLYESALSPLTAPLSKGVRGRREDELMKSGRDRDAPACGTNLRDVHTS